MALADKTNHGTNAWPTGAVQRLDRPHKVAMIAYPDAQVLDITGPLEVFSRAGRWLRDEGVTPENAYSVVLLAREAGLIRTSSGLELKAESLQRTGEIDTLLVTGGIGFRRALEDKALLAWIKNAALEVRRIGSICTGAMIRARAGLLEGRPATTHWAYCDELATHFGDVSVDADAIFVKNENIYTSAGVTSGMDLALAMVEEDWGPTVALAVAQELVLFLKRPGGQSQFSRFLEPEKTSSRRVRDLQAWILKNLSQDLSVARLAEVSSMSPRNFARSFAREMGVTPARYVEKIRIEMARSLLQQNRDPIEHIAEKVGFKGYDSFRRAFRREIGVAPSEYRERFGFAEVTPGERSQQAAP